MSSGEVSPSSITPAGTPGLATQPPKFGTLIPNRIFVGGVPADTQEQELKQFFTSYGAVKDCKIIMDRGGVSKGYGFVTFETQEDAEKILKKESESLIFKDRKLNIGHAIRKQAFPRLYEQSVSPGTILFSNGVPYTYQNGMAVFQPNEGYSVPTQPQASYPMMVPQQQAMYAITGQPGYAYQSPPAATPAQWATTSQWRWASQSPPNPVASTGHYMYPVQTMPEMYYAQPPPQAYQPTDLADASAVMEAAPAEGSMVMDPNMAAQYVNASQSTAAPLYTTISTSPEQIAHQQQQMSPHPSLIHHLPPKSAPVSYKRPFPASTPRKMLCTPPYSPRGAPPMNKFVHGASPRLITKTVNGTAIGIMAKDKAAQGIPESYAPQVNPIDAMNTLHHHS